MYVNLTLTGWAFIFNHQNNTLKLIPKYFVVGRPTAPPRYDKSISDFPILAHLGKHFSIKMLYQGWHLQRDIGDYLVHDHFEENINFFFFL